VSILGIVAVDLIVFKKIFPMKKLLFILSLVVIVGQPKHSFGQKDELFMAKIIADLFVDALVEKQPNTAMGFIHQLAIADPEEKESFIKGISSAIDAGLEDFDLFDDYYFKEGPYGKGHYYHVFYTLQYDDERWYFRVGLFNQTGQSPQVIAFRIEETKEAIYNGSKSSK